MVFFEAKMGYKTWLVGLVMLSPIVAHAQDEPRPVAPHDCFVVDIVLPAPDSMVASVPQASCGSLRLVFTGRAEHYTVPHVSQYVQLFRVPFALQNIGTHAFAGSLAMTLDSAAPVQRGRQINARYSPSFLKEFRRIGDTKTGIRPGERSHGDTLLFAMDPLAQRIRLWLTIREARRPHIPVVVEEAHAPRDQGQPGAAVERFVARAGLPKVRGTRVLLRVRKPELRIFSTSFGEPQDCPAGCFYSELTGLEYRGRVGWLASDTAIGHRFAPAASDTFLFSVAFHDTIIARFGRFNHLDEAITTLVLQQAHVPRPLLMRYLERVYEDVDGNLARKLADAPALEHEPDILARIASLPLVFYLASDTAKARLAKLAPVLVHDTTTSARTLWVLASMIRADADDSLITASIARHPNGRANPAILSRLAVNHAWVRPNVVASLRVSERVRSEVAALLDSHDPAPLIHKLLDDPEAGYNADVLLVLNNRFGNEIATRRLPEDTFRWLDPDYVLIP